MNHHNPLKIYFETWSDGLNHILNIPTPYKWYKLEDTVLEYIL